jgi:hypothetical protein
MAAVQVHVCVRHQALADEAMGNIRVVLCGDTCCLDGASHPARLHCGQIGEPLLVASASTTCSPLSRAARLQAAGLAPHGSKN